MEVVGLTFFNLSPHMSTTHGIPCLSHKPGYVSLIITVQMLFQYTVYFLFYFFPSVFISLSNSQTPVLFNFLLSKSRHQVVQFLAPPPN